MRELDVDEKLWLAAEDAIRQGRRLETASQVLLVLILLSTLVVFVLGVANETLKAAERVGLLAGLAVGGLVNFGVWQAASLFGVRGRLDGLRAQAEILSRDLMESDEE